MTFKTLMYSAAALSIVAFADASIAETVTTKTFVQTKELPRVNQIDFSVFDMNRDGFYSMPEVGERLFASFDRDGNGNIDNIEWDERTILTITPMEKETFKFVDTNNDGVSDQASYTYETFYSASGLIRFDENLNGLSAAEFIGKGYNELDISDDNMINLEEWKRAYLESRPLHDLEENYGH